MKIIFFYQPLLSDWSHGNAHFLRGYATELQERGHEVVVYEPFQNSSPAKSKAPGHIPPTSISPFETNYPGLRSLPFDPSQFDAEKALADSDLVIVHELNPNDLIARIGQCRARLDTFRLLLHDTHNRALIEHTGISGADLSHYDGVLTNGENARALYLKRGWVERAWSWPEAADIRIFFPRERDQLDGDIVWTGNGDQQDRASELRKYFLGPVSSSGVKARAYGARYPKHLQRELVEAGVEYGGWLPHFQAPGVFARFCVSLHIPRRFGPGDLPGIPAINLFEALACGIPVISSPWEDRDGLFEPEDFLVARNEREMRDHLWAVLNDRALARSLASAGRRTILAKHTCGHRVDQLLDICEEQLNLPGTHLPVAMQQM